ncbi:GTPase-activating protein S13 [Exophiala xenobiotica]|nr:GTPase-activating protein S13 [Exophiala xenobiotica]
MAQVIANSGHDDMIHDAVLDYYGRRLATCSSDKTIKIFEIDGDQHRLTETLKGHEGAVWCVAWAHPKFGTLLASSSYDGRVHIYRETPAQQPNAPPAWTLVFTSTIHTASVNMVSWAPPELGCLLACASSDGNVSVLEFRDNQWAHVIFPAHAMGVNAVSWAPAGVPGAITRKDGGGQSAPVRRFVTGGSDNAVKIWEFNSASQNQQYENTVVLPNGHTDWVRDVAWSPTLLSKSYIASASQDKTVKIWTSTNPADSGSWTSAKTLEFDAVLWRVSWSLSGNILAVSGGDNKVSLWKEDLKGNWEMVREVTE